MKYGLLLLLGSLILSEAAQPSRHVQHARVVRRSAVRPDGEVLMADESQHGMQTYQAPCSTTDAAWCNNGKIHQCTETFVQQNCCQWCELESNSTVDGCGEDGYSCSEEFNFVQGKSYSQISLTSPCPACSANPVYGGPNDMTRAVAWCKAQCDSRAGCTGFFFQKHGNGHEICGFYTGFNPLQDGGKVRHGHIAGSRLCGKGCAANPAQPLQLLWEDNFDGGPHPDPSIWRHDSWNAGDANSQSQIYTNRRDNSEVSGGTLKIKAKREHHIAPNGTTYGYTSASLTTHGRKDLTYGRVEVRAKMPTASGTWPAIWMLPNTLFEGTTDWPLCGEIDILETVGNQPGEVHFSVHTQEANFRTGGQATSILHDVDLRAWHNYSMDWTENRITGYLDGVRYFVVNKVSATEEVWPFNKPFALVLNVAVGGNWGGHGGIDPSAFDGEGQVMEVDWVRAYGIQADCATTDQAWCTDGEKHDCSDTYVRDQCCSFCRGNPETTQAPDPPDCAAADQAWCTNGEKHDCSDTFVRDQCCSFCRGNPETTQSPDPPDCAAADQAWCTNGEKHDCSDTYVRDQCCSFCRGTPELPDCATADQAWCAKDGGHDCSDPYVRDKCCSFCRGNL